MRRKPAADRIMLPLASARVEGMIIQAHNLLKYTPLMDDCTYKDVVVIGNGPSGITLSYMLAGNWPFYNGQPHPIDFLQNRLEDSPEKSILNQDLQRLSEGLEGRSVNPVSVLFDTLNHPLADLGSEHPSVLCWRKDKNSAVDHVILGKGTPGAAWQWG